MIIEKFDLFMDGIKASIRGFLEPARVVFDIFSNMWAGLLLVAVCFVLLAIYCVKIRKAPFRSLLKDTRVLAICALMMALNTVLGYFQITFSAYLRVGFGFITQPVIAMMFGPLVCAMTGMIQDILTFILNPTGAYIPAYTICVGISGMFYGLVLYKKQVTFLRCLWAKVLVIFIGNIILNSIALAVTAGSGFIGILPSRIIKNILLLPIQTVISYFILKLVQKRKFLKNVD